MKLILIALALPIIMSSVVRAQSLSFGPEIGINYIKLESNFTGNIYSGAWHGGGFAEYSFSEYFSIRSGIYFTQKKQSFVESDTSLNPILGLLGVQDIELIDLNTYSKTNGRVNQNYFELPIMAKASYSGFSLSAGVYGALMFSAVTNQVTVSNTPFLSLINLDDAGFLQALLPPASTVEEDRSESTGQLRTFDFGARFGASYRLDRLELNLGYALGLLDYRTNEGNTDSKKHQYFQLSLSYNFGTEPGSSNFWQSKKLQ